MFNMLIMFIFFTFISMSLMLLNFFISKKMMKNREKNSVFECGFDPMSNTRIPFSIQFFLISLMFLIFDIEISLLIPLIFSMLIFNIYMMYSMYLFMIILLVSLYFEYSENMLEWKK
uniref:NADH dehydrogenase subunit 3 n=1 Tax=Pachycondyla annamita TaxID=613577 RepID=UPI0025520633|nr:NADH dehydrogenase subunit 3 [Pachycondyla annamita]WGF22859.1 NADH dehydrogenase subunit 3 [Pachycondyla annamita]